MYQVSNRLTFIISITTIALIIIATNLFYLQVYLTRDFYKLGQRNFLRIEKIESPRGNIIDTTGTILATNRPVNLVYWQGTGQRKLTDEQSSLITFLKQYIDLSDDLLAQLAFAESKGQRLLLQYDLPLEQLSKIIELLPKNKNVLFDRHFKRIYPHKSSACHIVGYLGFDISNSGTTGLELICNDLLKGESGELLKTINSVGRQMHAQEVKKALSGDTVKTTLNIALQEAAERLFPEDSAGAFILMDPADGNLEVVLSRPSFDPNIFLNPINPVEWEYLQEKNCFINRAFNATYPPASIFKLITLAASLEEGIIDENSSWYCIGHTTFCGRVIQCGKKDGHGVVKTQQALAHSCNIPFYEIAKKVSIDTLAVYARKCGLGTETDIIFKEKTGLIPTSAWKKQVKKEAWWAGETLSAAIGQSYLLVTPIQIARMISGICHGHLIKPRILLDEPIVTQPLLLKQKTIDFLKNSMRSVVRQGTGQSLNILRSFEIFAKTGTAQTSGLEKEYLGGKYLAHGWFVAYFKYKDHPPKTIIIIIENAGKSMVSSKVALKFLREYAKIIDATPLELDSEIVSAYDQSIRPLGLPATI